MSWACAGPGDTVERTGCSQKVTAMQQEERAIKKSAGVKKSPPGGDLHLPWDGVPQAH